MTSESPSSARAWRAARTRTGTGRRGPSSPPVCRPSAWCRSRTSTRSWPPTPRAATASSAATRAGRRSSRPTTSTSSAWWSPTTCTARSSSELAAAGKHVLCEKPLAPTSADAQAMIDAVDAAGVVARVGFTFRRTPGIAAARQQIESGELGRPLYINAQYWTDYGSDPQAPMSWRYRGGPGSGALADLGSHLADTAEFLLGPVESVTGAALTTVIGERPLPLGHVVGHAHVEVSDQREPVENDDWASFSVRFAGGATGDLSVSRIAFGHPNTLKFEVFCERGAVAFDVSRAGEFAGRQRRRPTASAGSSSASTTPTSPAAWRWTRPASAPGTTTASSTRPARSSTRSPAATSCPATPRSPTGCTPCCWRRRSSGPPPRTPRPRHRLTPSPSERRPDVVQRDAPRTRSSSPRPPPACCSPSPRAAARAARRTPPARPVAVRRLRRPELHHRHGHPRGPGLDVLGPDPGRRRAGRQAARDRPEVLQRPRLGQAGHADPERHRQQGRRHRRHAGQPRRGRPGPAEGDRGRHPRRGVQRRHRHLPAVRRAACSSAPTRAWPGRAPVSGSPRSPRAARPCAWCTSRATARSRPAAPG